MTKIDALIKTFELLLDEQEGASTRHTMRRRMSDGVTLDEYMAVETLLAADGRIETYNVIAPGRRNSKTYIKRPGREWPANVLVLMGVKAPPVEPPVIDLDQPMTPVMARLADLAMQLAELADRIVAIHVELSTAGAGGNLAPPSPEKPAWERPPTAAAA